MPGFLRQASIHLLYCSPSFALMRKKAFQGSECLVAAAAAMSTRDPTFSLTGRKSGFSGVERYSTGILGKYSRVAQITARLISVFPQPIVSARMPKTKLEQPKIIPGSGEYPHPCQLLEEWTGSMKLTSAGL